MWWEKAFNRVGIITLISLVLSACNAPDMAPPEHRAPTYENRAYTAFLIRLTRLSTQAVQPIPETVPVQPKVVKLGKELFFSPQLSRNDTIACATCHILSQGGDDNRAVSFGIHGRKGEMNSPTVLNSGFNIAQFWDGRAPTLEAQAEGPITNPVEMGFDTLQQLVDKLNADDHWRQRFLDTFGEPPTADGLRFALAEYQRALITPGSRFDRYLMGDQDALNDQEKRGWHTFQQLGCINCHQGINLGGTLFQKIGLYKPTRMEEKRWLGRFNVTQHVEDKFVFKVPGLRNVADTAPYFHDGKTPTLEQAVAIMIEAQIGIPAQPETIDDLVAFLKTLSAPFKEVGLEP